MVRTLLIRGMICGFVAGLLVFAFARVFGEPQVDRAIAFESEMHAGAAQHGMADMDEPELVSRRLQAGFGLFTGVIVYATAFGGLFALVFAFANGRVSDLSPRAVSALLALAGIIAVYVVPSLKYPANPPAVGQAGTIGIRTAMYFSMMALSVGAMIGAAVLRERALPKVGAWSAALIASAAYVAAMTAVAAALPAFHEIPEHFPADLLWRFRVDAFAMQLIMWATIGLGFGALTERAARRSGGYRAGGRFNPAW